MPTEGGRVLFDRGYLESGLLCGIDEAGRGCLAGPVLAAAVVFEAERLPDIPINDSKRLTPRQREGFFELIAEAAVCWAVGAVGWKRIDELNIRNASRIAMERAYMNLRVKPQIVLVDGNMPLDIPARVETIVKGDTKSFVIAAASIMAKVTRDRIMLNYHRLFPEYGFDRHKGYPTKQHREAIKRHGPTRIHRLSFRLLRD